MCYIVKLAKKSGNTNDKWHNFLYGFGVKESDAAVILVIWGQLLPQRSPKGHLGSFSAIFLGLAPFFSNLNKSKLISEDIFEFYMISSLKWWYIFYF